MNTRLLFAAVGLLLTVVEPAWTATADLADLAPARTLAYLELHDPPALARELHALIKGSYLQHPALFFANHSGAGKKMNEEAFEAAWFVSSEFIDELGDWQGGFLALTGLTRKDDPVMVGVLRTGKSRMLPLALRMILIETGSIHCIARVEGVPLFQIGDAEEKQQPEIAQRFRAPARQLARALRGPRKASLYQIAFLENMPVEEADVMPESGFFLSLLPGAVAFGTTPEILSDTIRRLKGKSPSPSLATVPAFRAAAEMRNRPGLFAWANPPRLTRLINEALRRDLSRRQEEIRKRPIAKGEKRDAAKVRRQAEAEQRSETQEWTFFQQAANPSGMHYAAAGWSLHKGDFACAIEARMKEKQTSPLLDLLANQKLSPDLLRAVPGDAFALFALPLSDSPATLTRLLKLADQYIADSGEETPLPSKSLAEWEKSLKLHLGRDVLAKIRSAAVAVHLIGEPEKEASMYPLFVIEAISDNAAKDLESLLPRLLTIEDKNRQPRSHTIDGQLVRSLTDEAADPEMKGPPAHYGHRGKIVVVGWHRDGVAATLNDSTHKKDLLNLPRGLATLDAEGPVGAVGLFSGRQLLGHLARIGSEQRDQKTGHLRALRYLREMSTPMAAMPPTVFTMKRLANGARVEFRQSEMPVSSATVVDMALTWLMDEEAFAAFFKKEAGVLPPALILPPAGPAMPAAPIAPPPLPPLPAAPAPMAQ
jgi:hypothetical protein